MQEFLKFVLLVFVFLAANPNAQIFNCYGHNIELPVATLSLRGGKHCFSFALFLFLGGAELKLKWYHIHIY